jgi:Trypsin
MKSVESKVASSFFAFSAVALAALVACGPESPDHASAPSGAVAPSPVTADEVEVVQGIPDRDRDPAVVAIDIADSALCTGALVAPNVVLTARHCVAHTVEQIQCPATSPQVGEQRSPSSLHILVGDDAQLAQEVARGRAIVTPKGWALCDADIAFIVLDRDVVGIDPLPVRRQGVAVGDHVRAVGYGRAGDGQPAGSKLLRDHVKVLDTSDNEFVVGEATCQGDSGGPAIDESTGEIVGVVSRGGPACDGPNVHNIYTRTDVYLPLLEEALREAQGGGDPGGGGGDDDGDAGVHTVKDAGHKAKDAGAHTPPNDMGGECKSGGDCASGICVKDGQKQYCSRACGNGDRCPTHYGCEKAQSGTMVCVAK